MGVDHGGSHVVVEEDEPFHPLAIGLLGSAAAMPRTQRFAKLVEKFRLPIPKKVHGPAVH